ncbi:MAG TPA: hypothetical protein VMJ34_14175 [Bryobacteraceae bacterium]|nr:hypothetical protein [Bryobacteraceae bacterium]
MHSRNAMILVLGLSLLLSATATAGAPQPLKDATAVTDNAAGRDRAPAAAGPASSAESASDFEDLAAIMIVVGLAVIALLTYLLTLGIPGKLQALERSLGQVQTAIGQLQASIGGPSSSRIGEAEVPRALAQIEDTLGQTGGRSAC